MSTAVFSNLPVPADPVVADITAVSAAQLDVPVDAQSLKSAFQLFNELSSQLSESYTALEQQVAGLNGELKLAHAQRLEEIKEKQRVASRLQNLLDLLPGGVVVLDQYGVVRDCNPAAIDLLGEPLLGEVWLNVIKRSFAPRRDDGHEISLQDGRRISIATRSLDVEPGQIILLTDQTETRQLQHRLSRHERLSAMGKMMSSLAHQIRTPLAAAMLYAGHLTDSDLNPQQVQRFSHKILSRLNHLEQQVNDMLIFVRGDVKLTDTLSVDDLLIEFEQAMEVPLQSGEAHCEIVNSAMGSLIHCNRQTMIGALLNLLNNAIQACGRGGKLELNVQLLAHEEGGDHLKIAIVDNGPGMDKATLDQVQEAFFTTKSQGTGLGLSVVRAVARAHQGEFFIQSSPGEGTVAGILLPVYQPVS